jgi:branched-chain amino acid aminotransferase
MHLARSHGGVLEGITRNAIIQIVRRQTSLRFAEKFFKPKELLADDEIFFTGTAAEVIPVTKIDRQKIGNGKPGPVTNGLIAFFKETIKRESERS